MKIHEFQAKALTMKERMADNYDPVVWLLRKFRGQKKSSA
jgi:hypothetical protein